MKKKTGLASLPKSLRDHLRFQCINSIKGLIVVIHHQADIGMPCRDCLDAARRLGVLDAI